MVFTLNNYTSLEQEHLATVEAEYLCYGREVGESGTPHLQGFVLWKSRKTFVEAKSVLGLRVHVETARTLHAAIKYCEKDGDFVEFGTRPEARSHQAKHNLAELVDAYKQGGAKRAREVDEVGWVTHGTKIMRTIDREPCYRGDIEAIFVFGPPGCGKSRWAYENNSQAYYKIPQTKFWVGYTGQETVIIDDMCPGGVSLGNMLRWIDRYPCYVETKGGSIPLSAKKFIMTSNMTPRNIWKDDDQIHIDAFHRRVQVKSFNEIKHN